MQVGLEGEEVQVLALVLSTLDDAADALSAPGEQAVGDSEEQGAGEELEAEELEFGADGIGEGVGAWVEEDPGTRFGPILDIQVVVAVEILAQTRRPWAVESIHKPVDIAAVVVDTAGLEDIVFGSSHTFRSVVGIPGVRQAPPASRSGSSRYRLLMKVPGTLAKADARCEG